MSIPARYPGRCPECGGAWQPGDLIQADIDRQWQHATCPDDTDDLTPTHPVCERCWLTHPEGACDR